MTEVTFVDTTLRDGQQSLWAYNMRTGMIAPVAELLDEAGFEAIELGGPVELPKCVKELRENPWERYRLIVPKFKKTPLRLIHGTRSGFAIYPNALHQLYDTCMARAGVSEVRISDSWNDPNDWAWRVQQAKNAGLKPIINLIYTVSPRHTDEHFATPSDSLLERCAIRRASPTARSPRERVADRRLHHRTAHEAAVDDRLQGVVSFEEGRTRGDGIAGHHRVELPSAHDVAVLRIDGVFRPFQLELTPHAGRPKAVVTMELRQLIAETHLVQLMDGARREAIATRLLARERLPFDDRDFVAELGEPVRGGGTGGTSPDHQYVSRCGHSTGRRTRRGCGTDLDGSGDLRVDVLERGGPVLQSCPCR